METAKEMSILPIGKGREAYLAVKEPPPLIQGPWANEVTKSIHHGARINYGGH